MTDDMEPYDAQATRVITVRVPRVLHNAVKKQANREGRMSMNALANEALLSRLDPDLAMAVQWSLESKT